LRYISSAGYIVNKAQSLLDPNTVHMLLHLRDWCRWHWSSYFQHIATTLNWLVNG